MQVSVCMCLCVPIVIFTKIYFLLFQSKFCVYCVLYTYFISGIFIYNNIVSGTIFFHVLETIYLLNSLMLVFIFFQFYLFSIVKKKEREREHPLVKSVYIIVIIFQNKFMQGQKLRKT